MSEAHQSTETGPDQRPGLAAFGQDPDLFLFDIQAGPSMLFAHRDENTFRTSAFLDGRIQPRPTRFSRLEPDQLEPLAGVLQHTPDLLIAHTSFCASTLLARCLQHNELLCLREPRVLSTLANAYRQVGDTAQMDALSVLVFKLLAKRYRPGQRVIV